jgi:hypothetical protein
VHAAAADAAALSFPFALGRIVPLRAASLLLLEVKSHVPTSSHPPKRARFPLFYTQKTDARRSGAGAALVAAAVLPWTLCFMLGGPAVVGQAVFDALDVRKVDLGMG